MMIIIGCDKREMGKKTGVQTDEKIPGAAGTLGKATAKSSCPEWHPLRDVNDFPGAFGHPHNHPHKAIISPQGFMEKEVGIN